jgi:hypothetical protein
MGHPPVTSYAELIAALEAWGLEDSHQKWIALGSAALTCRRHDAAGRPHYLIDAAIGLVEQVHQTREGELRRGDLQALALNIADVMRSDPGQMRAPSGKVAAERRDLHG